MIWLATLWKIITLDICRYIFKEIASVVTDLSSFSFLCLFKSIKNHLNLQCN